MISSPRFSHRPLEDAGKQIRLLQILLDTPRDPIRCKTSVHDLDGVQDRFIAISYAWGHPGSEGTVKVDGQAFLARPNCLYALCQMRNYALFGQRPQAYYWIDSICINQDDSDEKCLQIPLMGQIFSGASYVAACIGGLDRLFVDLVSMPASQVGGNKAHNKTIQLRRRKYFNRLWIAQECMVAKDVVVFCGSRTLGYWEWNKRIELNNDLARRAIPRLVGLPVMTSPPGLPHSICLLSGRACSNLHDKVYALLSLATREESEALRVNYDQSSWSLLTEYATKMSLIRTSHIDTLRKSITALARDFSSDDAFKIAVRRFVAQRIETKDEVQPANDLGETTIRLHGTIVGYLADKVKCATSCLRGHYLEDCPQKEGYDLPLLRSFQHLNSAVPGAKPTPDKFRLGRITHNMWDVCHEDHVPWRAFCSLDSRQDATPLQLLAPSIAKAGDLVVQVTDYFIKPRLLLCRESGSSTLWIVGNILYTPVHYPSDWDCTKVRCRRCQRSACCGVWNIHMHIDDFINFALLQDDEMALVCTPFTTLSTRSHIELSDSCVDVP